MKLDTHDLAWLGGMIDADGTIAFKTSKGKPVSLQVSVFNTDLRIINKTKSILDSLNVKYDYSVRNRGGRTADFYEVRVSKLEQVCYLLTVIENFLVAKRDRAILARTWSVKRLIKRAEGLYGHRAKITKDELVLAGKAKELQSSYKTYGTYNGKL